MAVKEQARRAALEEIKGLARELQTATSARQRYEISQKMNNLSKHAQADIVRLEEVRPWRDEQRWRLSNFYGTYDHRMDIFYLYAPPLDPATCIYARLGDCLALISSDTHELVGYQIDNFRSVWLTAHPEVQAQAQTAARPLAHPSLRGFGGAWADLIRTVMNSLIRESQGISPPMQLSR